MTLPDETVIQGDFRNDQLSTGARFYDSHKNVYEPQSSGTNSGRFVNGRLYGQGKILFVNGDVYEGMFKDGKRCGHGKMQYKSIRRYNDFGEDVVSQKSAGEIELDWAVYDGNWNDNCRHGYGVMKWSDDSVYKGEWRKDERYYGKMIMVTGNEYTGYWKHDRFHGKGTLKTDDGHVFEGEFRNGFREKFGKITYPEGAVYVGEIEGMNKHGKGRLEEHGNVYEGYFEDNKKNVTADQLSNKTGKMYYANGDYYNGDWMDDRREGNGTMYFAESKEVYEGEWMGDARCGIGKLMMKDGTVIESQWRNNKAQGEGKMIAEGSVILT